MRERAAFDYEMSALDLRREYETLDAVRTEAIERFMRREKDWQQWRVLAHLDCGALELTRNSTKSLLKRGDKVKDGDKIELKSPLPAACANKVQTIPQAEYRDYCFANPKPADDYEKFVIQLLGLYPQTVILSNSSVDTLVSFIRSLKKDERVTHPIRNLIIASHASRTGRLAMRLSSATTIKEIAWEDLEPMLTSKSLEIDPQLLQPRPKVGSQTLAPQLHIKGCNVGNPLARPFLDLFKKVLGGNIRITAPKHFHSMKVVRHIIKRGQQVISNKIVEIWEFFSYEFVLLRTTPLTSKADAVAAFLAAPDMKLIDGTAVRQSDWDRWIPPRLPQPGRTATVNVAVSSALSSKANSVDGQFRYRMTFFFGKEWHEIPVAADPGTDAKRKEEIKKSLQLNDRRFKSGHAYPLYARTGFKDIDAYLDSYAWRFKFNANKGQLSFSGTRHEYTVLAPIVEPASNTLCMNLFPIPGSPTIPLVETDQRFFASV